MEEKTIVVSFGTRPELIKMAPVIQELQAHFKVEVWCTGQHTDLVEDEVKVFDIRVDWNANVRSVAKNRSISGLYSQIVASYSRKLEEYSSETTLVMVHGDTTSALAVATAAKYGSFKVAHVEAGLRSGNNLSPFPEELNRKGIAVFSDFHFAPTERSRENLAKEGISEGVFVVGNSVLDNLKKAASNYATLEKRDQVLVTIHRRENLPFLEGIYQGIREIARNWKDLTFIYPLHPNPIFRKTAKQIFEGVENIALVDAQGYREFTKLLFESKYVITDSGGIQEEATFLNIPTLVARNETERVELKENDGLFLAGVKGADFSRVFREMSNVVIDKPIYTSPLGNGDTGKLICDRLLSVGI